MQTEPKELVKTSREEFQLRTHSGRTVLSYDQLDRAAEKAFERNLRIFHVVMFEREITSVAA